MQKPLRTFATSAVEKATYRRASHGSVFALLSPAQLSPALAARRLSIFHRGGRRHAVIQVFHLIRYLRP